ncbi:uncharacterized protein FOMMEDRAFT_162739 [Fomitiporia mediterranea MF3/22]|uniref:RRM domain-containing protein n=1 Tax=Fomitiporia mediterranea (strain MF3/22) TaxID=694068 RepID=R7SG80_FOMME|nr:uncharacterized protein FOMMEDRAFT_162739 [Fomitiporia mediterranea MF3/22]EJC97716.1 hypothetical protein FOMMEDRAFT_162739 [Fomitiporia mediterranea MF3/22]
MHRAPRGRVNKPYDRSRASDDKWVHDKAPVDVPKAVVNAGPGPQAGPLNSRLVVSNLHYEITAKDLIAIFGQIGTLVREPDIKVRFPSSLMVIEHYDRSGRSTGVALLQFETPVEATRAKNQFNKILAKGQPMEVAYDTRPVKRFGSDPKALLKRISKAPLHSRLTSDSSTADGDAATTETQTNGGPMRTRGRRGRGGGTRGGRFRKEPKTAEDLDKELDAFMGDDNSSKQPVSAPVPAQTGDADVEMAA